MPNKKYTQIVSDEPIHIDFGRACLNLACCDCGLVHHIDFIPEKPRHWFFRLFPHLRRYNLYFQRDNRKTARLRVVDDELQLKHGSGKWKMIRAEGT